MRLNLFIQAIIAIILFFAPLIISGQESTRQKNVDSPVFQIENDHSLTKKTYDTVSYEKEDGGDRWDSLYLHRAYFYKAGQIVKISDFSKCADWRSDMVCNYWNGKVLKFSKGEGIEGSPNYAQLAFEIYYFNDQEIKVSWLISKPDNVIGIASDIFLQWAYSLLKEKK